MGKCKNVKMRYRYNMLLVVIMLVGTIASLNVSKSAVKVKEENSVADVYSDEKQKKHSLTAVIYNDNKYGAGGKGVVLSKSGATVTGWEEGAVKYLQIDATLHEHNKKGHTIRVELPKEFYVVGEIDYKPTGVSEVKFSKNSNISLNNGGTTYKVNEQSGTLTYYISPNIGELTIQVAIAYDSRFWDKQTNSAITASSVAPISVSMNYEDNPGTYESKGELSKVKISKVTSGKGTKRYGFYPMYSFRYDLTETNTKDLELEVLETTQKMETTYLKEGYIEISIPYATDSSGKKHYLTYDYNKIEWVKEFFHGGMNIEVVEKSVSKIKVKLSNMMFNTRDMIVLPLTYPSSMKTTAKYVTFKKGHLKIYGTSNNGSSVTMIDEDMDEFEYATSYAEDLEYHVYPNKNLYYYTGKDAVSFLGGVYIENKGNLKSGEKTITFNFPKELLVTTINLPVGKDNKDINIEYSLYDENLNTVSLGGKTSWTVTIPNDTYPYSGWVHNTFTTLTRNKLPSEHSKYYFKTVKYNTAGFAPASRIYMYQAEYDNGSAGNFYGYQSKNMKSNTTYNVGFNIKSKNGGQQDVRITKSVSTTQTSAMGIDSAKFDVTRAFAGSDVTIEGSFFVNAYPYGNSQFVDTVRLGLLLPNGISFTKDSVKLTLQDGSLVGVNSVTSKKATGTSTFWIIEANKKMIGYCSETINTINNGNRMNFRVILATDPNIKLTTLSTYNVLYGSALNVSNDSFGNYGWTRSVDKYDLNGNGKTNDYVSITKVEQAVECVIEPGKADIELNDSISITGMGSVSGNVATIKASGDVISYTMQLKSIADNYATSLAYYIPIPKSNSVIDTKLVTGQSGNMFDMTLMGAATETGSAIKSIEYLVQEGINYTSAVELSDSNWYTAQELISNGYNYNNVTMIKAVVKDGAMTRGMTSTLKINLKAKDANLNNILKRRNDFKCSGYYTLKRDGINVGGWISSSGVSACIADSIIVPSNPTHTGPEEYNGKKMYLVYENENEILHKDKIEFKVETDYEETRLTFNLSGGAVSSRDFKLYKGKNEVRGSGNSFIIDANTTYRIEFSDSYLFNKKSSNIDFELDTLVEYWLWEGKWETEWQRQGSWYWDSVDEEWYYGYSWVQVPVYNMYKNRYEYDETENIKVIKRRVFVEN